MPKDRKFKDIVAYFRQLATEHREIAHTETEKHFFRYELDEVLIGLPRGMNYPAMVLEGYRFSLLDGNSDNVVKRRDGAFMLLDHIPDTGDHDHIHKVWGDLEEIGDDIIARIRRDKRNPASPVRDFNTASVEANLLSTEFGNLYGIRFTFTMDATFEIDVNEERWLTE
jgi:hypothetical protein